eukprot:14287795-Ditylum_brightwellii.AAC.1
MSRPCRCCCPVTDIQAALLSWNFRHSRPAKAATAALLRPQQPQLSHNHNFYPPYRMINTSCRAQYKYLASKLGAL